MGLTIIDVLSQKTTPVSEPSQAANDFAPEIETPKPAVNDAHFSPQVHREITEPLQTPVQEIPEYEEESEELTEEESENSAEALIDMIDMAQKTLFTIWAVKRENKKIPKKVLKSFEDIAIKELLGEELTDTEQKQLLRFKKYETRMETIKSNMPFTEEEKQDLFNCTKAFVKTSGFNIPPGLWFGAQLLNAFSKRAIDVIM